MGKNLTSIVCSLVIAACGGASSLETATELPKTPRRPDGVVVERRAALPIAVERAPARGMIALREPLADKDVEDVVRAYIRAFEREDDRALAELLAQDAAPLGRPPAAATRMLLLEHWRTKMKNFEYQKLAGLEVARLSQIEKHTFETLGSPGMPVRPPEMRQGDIYVRVPIATPRVGQEQLFGEFLILLLRKEGGQLKIAGQADEN